MTFIQQGLNRMARNDQELASRMTLRDTLELDDYRTCGVTNGVQALKAFSHFRPEVIVTKVTMLEKDH